MYRFASIAALAAATLLTPAKAHAQSMLQAEAIDDHIDDRNAPIACVYRTLRKNDFPMLVRIVRQGMRGQTADEKEQVNRIGEAAMRCRQRYGWGKPREDAALRYFAGRVLTSNATFELKDFGLTFTKLSELVARLDAPTRAAYLSGQVSNDQSRLTLEALAAVGVDFAAVPEDKRAMFGQKLSQGIVGLLLQQEARAAFDA